MCELEPREEVSLGWRQALVLRTEESSVCMSVKVQLCVNHWEMYVFIMPAKLVRAFAHVVRYVDCHTTLCAHGICCIKMASRCLEAANQVRC
jgi:hypothetical protein